MGPKRSRLAVYNAERKKAQKSAVESPPGAWDKAATKWRWKERAEKWDEHLRQQDREAYEQERLDNRQRRRDILIAYQGVLVKAMAKLDPEDARWNEITAGIKMVAQELRAEYDDEPTRRSEIIGKSEGQESVDVGSALTKLARLLNDGSARREEGKDLIAPDE